MLAGVERRQLRHLCPKDPPAVPLVETSSLWCSFCRDRFSMSQIEFEAGPPPFPWISLHAGTRGAGACAIHEGTASARARSRARHAISWRSPGKRENGRHTVRCSSYLAVGPVAF